MRISGLSSLATILAIVGLVLLPERAFSQEAATGDLVPETTTSLQSLQEELSVSGQRALLYQSDRPGFASSVKSALVGTGQFGSADIDILDMASTPASLTTLLGYGCVYVWTNVPPPNPAAQGDRLKDYVDAGGGVVLSTWALSPTPKPWEMQGGIMTADYSPFVNTVTDLSSFPRSLDFGTALTGHPMLAGVTDFSYGGNTNYGVVTVDPGAVLVASDNFGVPLLGINARSDVAAINVYVGPFFTKSAGVFKTLANACTAVSIIRVDIDIKPGGDPNSINLTSGGAVPVAIFGSATFDVTEIDRSTLSMADAGVKVVGKKSKDLCSVEDVDGDGFDDLVCHFDTVDLGALDGTSSEATVKGSLIGGRTFEGKDTVNIVKE